MSILGEDKNQKGSIDRSRTNLLRGLEQPTLLFLCRVMPRFLTPDLLTAILFCQHHTRKDSFIMGYSGVCH